MAASLAEPAPAPMVELVGIGRTYGAAAPVVALRGVNLEIEASGSGKTTLLNIIGCLDRPTTGSYRLDGVDVARLTDKQRAGVRSREIGFVFQSFHLLAYRTVLENVMLAEVYGRRGRAGRAGRAQAALEAVGLEGRSDFLPTKLSGGQRQRVAIARALANGPRLLLCDEPTGNLDSASTAGILDLLSELQGGGLTIVVITHDAGVAARAERQVRIVDGRISGGL
jgi:ABC-type lipoprotein export system ATPase subunit